MGQDIIGQDIIKKKIIIKVGIYRWINNENDNSYIKTSIKLS